MEKLENALKEGFISESLFKTVKEKVNEIIEAKRFTRLEKM